MMMTIGITNRPMATNPSNGRRQGRPRGPAADSARAGQRGWPDGVVRVHVGRCRVGDRVGIEGVTATVDAHLGDGCTRVVDVKLPGARRPSSVWMDRTNVVLIAPEGYPVVVAKRGP